MESPLPDPTAKTAARRLPNWLAIHHLALFVLSALVGLAVGGGLHRYLVDAFVVQSGREKATALELIDAFVDTYAANRDGFANPAAPVPATFRAHALARFAAGRAAADKLGVVMVGMPGREIATMPGDEKLTLVLRDLARSGVASPVTTLTEVGGQRLLRTVLPSLAGQDSCVQCHNTLQPDANWQRGDMMGAFVVDVPADRSLAQFQRDALLAGLASFLACFVVGHIAQRVIARMQALRAQLEREAASRLSGAIENMPAAVALFDAEDRLFLANEAYLRAHRVIGDVLVPGVAFETILRENVRRSRFDLGATEAEAYVAARLAQHRDPGPPIERRLTDGRWEQVRERRLADGGLALVIIDITREKEREEELKAALEAATTAVNQQRSFVSIVAHEFRTPLTIIDGAAQRIARRLDTMSADDIRDRLGKVRSGVERMSALVERILGVARLEAGKIELDAVVLDLAAFVEAQVERFGTVEAGFEIGVVTPAGSVPVSADPRLMEQVCINLLGNAIKYSGSSRRVDVTVGAQAGRAFLAVRDYGVGIPADELSQVSKRFYRARTARGVPGTGIGLHFVRELVRLHGGDLGIESDVGVGTTITIQLPLVSEATGAAAQPRGLDASAA